jgi:NitT/TauT family transport system ATP-binding protein
LRDVMTASAATPALSLSNIAIAYEGGKSPYVAVDGVNLDIPPGRFVSVVGPTGCGKSTLLSVLAGLLRPSRGEVRVDGTPLRGLNTRAGFMFQQDALLPWKTLLDNVAFGLQLRGVGRGERERAARQWIAKVGLKGFESSYPYQLSGGMRKRTSIAQAWIVDPPVLLMDEPFSSLDVQTRQVMENELLTLWAGTGKSVVFVTHDLDEAVSLSDEVVLLSAGPRSRIVGRYAVDLDRPRDLLSIRGDKRFTEIYNAIWADLKKEVTRTYERQAAGSGTDG